MDLNQARGNMHGESLRGEVRDKLVVMGLLRLFGALATGLAPSFYSASECQELHVKQEDESWLQGRLYVMSASHHNFVMLRKGIALIIAHRSCQ